MEHAQAALPSAYDLLRAIQEHKRLLGIVSALTRELERLDDEVRQLRAAIAVYREVIRRAYPRPKRKAKERVRISGEPAVRRAFAVVGGTARTGQETPDS
jgi:hypothetical protein